MKKALFIAAVFSAMLVQAQVPEGISYQACLNGNDGAVAYRDVLVKFSILKSSGQGAAVYSESHNTRTNSMGRLEVEIGRGTPLSGRFDTIDWLSGDHYLKSEFSLDGGSSFVFNTSQQLISVPYALAAKEAYTTTAWEEAVPVYEADIRRIDSLLQLYSSNLASLDTLIHNLSNAGASPATCQPQTSKVEMAGENARKSEAVIRKKQQK